MTHLKKLAGVTIACAAFSASFAAETITFGGADFPLYSVGSSGTGTTGSGGGSVYNQIRTKSSTATSAYTLDSVTMSGSLTSINSGTYASEARVRVSNSGYTAASDYFDLQLFSGNTFTSVSGSQTLSIPVAWQGRSIATNSTWTFRFFESYWDSNGSGATGYDSQWTALSFTFNNALPTPTNTDHTTAQNLGNLNLSSAPITISTGTTQASQVLWFKATVSATTSSLGYLVNSFQAGGVADTFMAVYDNSGNLLGVNDNSNNPDPFSGFYTPVPVMFGGTTSQSAMVFGASGGDMPLTAGTYYFALAANGANVVTGNNWQFTTDGTSRGAMTFRMGPVPEPASIAALGLGVAAMLRRRRAKKA